MNARAADDYIFLALARVAEIDDDAVVRGEVVGRHEALDESARLADVLVQEARRRPQHDLGLAAKLVERLGVGDLKRPEEQTLRPDGRSLAVRWDCWPCRFHLDL